MSNYLYQLIAKNFNLINTIQPLVLSAFEPLPESIPNWEPSTLTTEETELPKSTPNLPEEPNFKLSLGGFFPESVLSQSTPGNLLLTPNTDEEINPTPPITDPTRLLQKQLTEIDSVVYFGQSPEVGSGEQLPTQPISESEMISPAINQIASPPSSEPFKPAPVSQTKPSLSSRVVSVLATESNTSLSNPIDGQSQPKTKSFPQQLIEINRLALSLQSPFKPDWQIYFHENQTETVVFSFASQENTFSQPSLNPTIFRTAIANKNNAPMSRLTVEKLGELTTQLLNNQSIGINQAVYLHTSPQILHLKQSPTQVQAENSTILPILNILQPDNSSYLGNLSLNLSPKRRETLNFLPDSVGTGVRDLGFSYHVKSQAIDQVLPIGDQKPLTSVLRMETSTSTLNPVIQPQEKLVSELLQKQPLQITGNISSPQVPKVESSKIFSSQILKEPTAMPRTGNSWRGDANAYTPAVDSDNSSYLENLSLNLSPKRKETLNFLPDSVATGVRDLGFSGGFSYHVKSQAIDQVLPIGDQKPLTSVLRVETSTSTLNPVIQPQEKLVSELLQKQPLQITGNISSSQVPKVESSEIFSSQILKEPTAMSRTGNSCIGDANAYTPAVDSDNSSYLENLSLNLSPKRKETLNYPPDSVGTGVRDLGFSYHVKSQAIDQVLAIGDQKPLTSVLRMETSTSTLNPVIKPQEKLVSELLQKQPLQITGNISSSQVPKVESSEIFSSQILKEPTAMSRTGNSCIGDANAYTPAVDSDNSSYLENLSLNLSPKRKETLDFLPDSVATGVRDLGFSYHVKSQAIDQVLAIGDQKRLTSVLRMETSTSTLNPVIQPQVEPIAMSTTGFANAQSRNFPIESSSHKQTLTPAIARETSFTLPHSIAEQHSKLASDVSEVPQRFVHKNVSSIQPRLADASPKLSSLQTNSYTALFGDNLSLSVTSQPVTQLTAIHSDIIPTPALHPSTAGTDRQPQISFSDSHLSDFRGNETSTQEVGSQNHNRNYHKYIDIQKINPNEGIVTNPVEKLILPQNSSSNFSMSADRGKEGVQSSYFRQLEESDLKPLSVPMNDVTVKSLSVLAASSKEDRKRISGHLETPPVIQVSIGRLEVRNAAPAPPLPRPKARPAPSVMSLNDYLRRRAGGKR
ncbi:hypothetical protein [Nostoc sp.]|uniref:hypothetical protein n=1 Tax=Nostoc sp. TaxID=1180 RepID=UPI002FFC9708